MLTTENDNDSLDSSPYKDKLKEENSSNKITISQLPLTAYEKEDIETSGQKKVSKIGGSIRIKTYIRLPKPVVKKYKDESKTKKENKEVELDLDKISEEGTNLLKKDGTYLTSDKELLKKIKESQKKYFNKFGVPFIEDDDSDDLLTLYQKLKYPNDEEEKKGDKKKLNDSKYKEGIKDNLRNELLKKIKKEREEKEKQRRLKTQIIKGNNRFKKKILREEDDKNTAEKDSPIIITKFRRKTNYYPRLTITNLKTDNRDIKNRISLLLLKNNINNDKNSEKTFLKSRNPNKKKEEDSEKSKGKKRNSTIDNGKKMKKNKTELQNKLKDKKFKTLNYYEKEINKVLEPYESIDDKSIGKEKMKKYHFSNEKSKKLKNIDWFHDPNNPYLTDWANSYLKIGYNMGFFANRLQRGVPLLMVQKLKKKVVLPPLLKYLNTDKKYNYPEEDLNGIVCSKIANKLLN